MYEEAFRRQSMLEDIVLLNWIATQDLLSTRPDLQPK